MPDIPTERLRRGAELELAIEALDRDGHGIGRAGGILVAVRAVPPGARVRVRVRGRRRGRLEATLLEVLEEGSAWRTPRCEHFGTCGGCSFQNLAYPVQLEELHRSIVDALRVAGAGEVPVDPVIGQPDPWHYRNKMDFTFGNRRWREPGEEPGAEDGFALGLHVPGRFEKVLDVRSCAIHFAEADGLLTSVRRLARARGLEPWDPRAHTGLLRHLVLRKGARTGEILVDLVTSRDELEVVSELLHALVAEHPEVTTAVQSVNTRPASIAVGERVHVHFGAGEIREQLAGLTFTISPASFFQTNTEQAERLVALVREEADCRSDELLYDLYCGAGTLGLTLAAQVREVRGFESVRSAVLDARRNARENGIANATFVEGDVLPALADEGEGGGARVCLVDPPRAGLHPKVVPALCRLAPRRIVYVSCNVQAAARDLPALAVGGYALRRARPIDLFPHTPHVEVVLTLDRVV